MKKIIFVLALALFSQLAPAQTKSKTKISGKSGPPRAYIMMKQGKLVEVYKGRKTPVKKDVTLRNQTTIHPNGAIDASSGENLQLKEGQYITMDGRIRNLKDMPRP